MHQRVLAITLAGAMGVAALVSSVSPAGAATTQLRAHMTGAQEVAGDPNGAGTAVIDLHTAGGYLCFDIMVTRVHLPTFAAHIHQGAVGVAGPPVVTLAAPDRSGHSNGCVTADPAVLRDIAHHPANYYVNVHNYPFPAGAVRGQLHA